MLLELYQLLPVRCGRRPCLTNLALLEIAAGEGGAAEKFSGMARRLGMSTAGITQAADALESFGLARRAAVPEDRRTFRLTVTEAGRELLARIRETGAGEKL